jgi:hypothetical protein
VHTCYLLHHQTFFLYPGTLETLYKFAFFFFIQPPPSPKPPSWVPTHFRLEYLGIFNIYIITECLGHTHTHTQIIYFKNVQYLVLINNLQPLNVQSFKHVLSKLNTCAALHLYQLVQNKDTQSCYIYILYVSNITFLLNIKNFSGRFYLII